MSVDSSHAGIAAGVATGIYKGITLLFTTALTSISWGAVFDTAVLAFLGGAVGWVGAELMKVLKGKYLKYKRSKDDKED